MKNIFLAPVARTINSYLKLDPESQGRMRKLQGKVVTIELLPFHFTFQCVFQDEQLTIQSDELQPAETKICGTPLQLCGVMMTKENRNRFFADDIAITGDAALGQQVIELFDELEIDWEEQLSRFVGDVPAHQMGRLLRDMSGWFNRVENSFARDISDYVHEEKQWFPTRDDLGDFFNEVDSIRLDVDRIEARVNHLRASLSSNEEAQ